MLPAGASEKERSELRAPPAQQVRLLLLVDLIDTDGSRH